MTDRLRGRLHGRTVLVTGGNRGIGLGLASGVAAAGATVVIWGRDETANESACHELAAAGAARVESVVCDIADSDRVTSAFDETAERVGPVHAVFANAGVTSAFAPFHEQTDDEWRRTFEVNVLGTVRTLRAAVQHMLEHGQGGALVGVASMASRIAMRNFSPYSASKAAVENLMQSLAVEYARKGIRANSILPGWVDTDMTSDSAAVLRERVQARTPVARYGVPQDFREVAVFLADPDVRFHTGDAITVDGGYLKV